jgi:hypothetical protein
MDDQLHEDTNGKPGTALVLTAPEHEELCVVLGSYLADLRQEIAHTDRYAFREMLKERRAVLQGVLRRLKRERSLPPVPALGEGGVGGNAVVVVSPPALEPVEPSLQPFELLVEKAKHRHGHDSK